MNVLKIKNAALKKKLEEAEGKSKRNKKLMLLGETAVAHLIEQVQDGKAGMGKARDGMKNVDARKEAFGNM